MRFTLHIDLTAEDNFATIGYTLRDRLGQSLVNDYIQGKHPRDTRSGDVTSYRGGGTVGTWTITDATDATTPTKPERPRFCPVDGKAVSQVGTTFVEAGEYDDDRGEYESECDVDVYACADGHSFGWQTPYNPTPDPDSSNTLEGAQDMTTFSDYDVRDIATLLDEGGSLTDIPPGATWVAIAADLRIKFFPSESDACAFQREHRSSHGKDEMTGE